MKTATPLFLQVKNQIYAQILDGNYSLGQRLPTESDLCAEFKASRVTIRKALDELKAERVVSSVQGQGTIVTLDQNVSKNALDTIALIASAHDYFFGSFLDTFDQLAAQQDALVVYKSDPDPYNEETSTTFKHIHARHIRNCVLWPNLGFHNEGLLERLRLLGINLVFFDHIYESAHADCVTLDNVHAIKTLHTYLKEQGHKQINYIGWNDVPISSTAERIEAFQQLNDKPDQIHLFNRSSTLETEMLGYLTDLSKRSAIPDALLCGNGDLACSMQRALEKFDGNKPQVVCVDEFPRNVFPDMVCYTQPMKKMAAKCFICLVKQNDPDLQWQAKTYRIKGVLLK